MIGKIVPATKNHYVELLKKSDQWYEKRLIEEKIPSNTIKLVSKEIVEVYQVIPVNFEKDSKDEKGRLTLVTDRQQNLKAFDLFEEILKIPVAIKMTDSNNIKNGIKHYYDLEATINNYLEDSFISQEDDTEEKEVEADSEEKSQIVIKVNNLIRAAINKGASDIHLLPGNDKTFVLLRIDGILVNITRDYSIIKREKNAVVNIIKSICNPPMNISNRLMPAGGSFKVKGKENWIDCRVSTTPTIRGQKVVIRLLDTSRVALDIDLLGFSNTEQKEIDKVLQISSGLFIVTGPTGSGKSTTLHAILKKFNGLESNTITIENPVEYKDENITQIEAREAEAEKLVLDGKKILKVILRQDPDNIFYGEVRDEEDAAIALKAAQTGHRVFTTLHTKDCISTLDRLFDMGIKKTSLLLELNCIISQRLVRHNCTKCYVSYTPAEKEIILLKQEEIDQILLGDPKKGGEGCTECHDGYVRSVISEMIIFDNSLRDFLRHEHGISEILDELRKRKFKTMWEEGLSRVKDGRLELGELIRVVSPNR